MKIEEMFPSVAKAAAHAQMSGGDENYRVAEHEFDARSVAYLIENYEVEEQIVMKPHTVKVLREVAS